MLRWDVSYVFKGFHSPQFTQLPNAVVDELLPHLNEGELKCLLYIIRRTFGFQRDSDNISLSQMVDGLVTLEWNGKTQDYRLEMDMDNHERWYMLENFKAYLKLPERSPVLYVVPSEKRKKYLLQWALAVATKDHLDSSFIWIAVMPKNPLDYVWYAPNTPEAFPLLGGPWGSP